MPEPIVSPYGSWRSPISSGMIASKTVRLAEIVLDGGDSYWLESRPEEGGRTALIRFTTGGERSDVTPPPYNVRTRVHEYGGGAYTVAGGTVYFVNFLDQRLYRQDPGIPPKAITPESPFRYADLSTDVMRNRLICVREDHSTPGQEAVNCLVSLDVEGGDSGHVLVTGNDFYSSPRLSPDGFRLAWLTWNHPNMPWDGTELWVADLMADGGLHRIEKVAGGVEESIFQPEWSPDGSLYFVSDRTGWWNLHSWRAGKTEAVLPMEADFGQPQWVFGMSTYGFVSSENIICSFTRGGIWELATLDTITHEMRGLENPYTQIYSPRIGADRVVFIGSSPAEPPSVVLYDLNNEKFERIRSSSEIEVEARYISIPEPIEFPTEGGLTAHAFYYPPKNEGYSPSAGERPPLLVFTHGGPTAATSTGLRLEIQYWTSRGIAVLDVNYGGSSGYGRAYRERLNGQWGIVDVDDSINGARFLVERGDVDGNRLAIRGGSAGGYTTLCALTFRDYFKVGASYFGVSDLEALAKDTHKFESRYLDRLVGPYPEAREIYKERSPIHFTDRLSCPVILLQGLEDAVVPPNQAEMIFAALKAKGLPVAYLPFEGEQHGFRRAENIQRALEVELYFYARILGFELPEGIEPVPIENL